MFAENKAIPFPGQRKFCFILPVTKIEINILKRFTESSKEL